MASIGSSAATAAGTATDGKEETVNIKVAVRCRPLNKEEKAEGTPAVVTCNPAECQVDVTSGKRVAKSYCFDHVFGAYSTQEEVFNTLIVPVIEEVLEGFNCTVFAYGQTGTGKTYTMEGELGDGEHAGIIPRAINRMYEYLEATHSEYSVRISFLELYNEQLEDLLVEGSSASKLRIVEDARRGVLCQNLEEILVHSSEEVFKIIAAAINKRKVAETQMNKASSRSHCIFTLTIHTKETTPDGEDLLKVGKLNLVDLAGSECIGRSGATKGRAREAGNINQSLLTLGRVITALVEHHPHVPYRDSKLTRLLQESLGGRTKTCIIATMSPSVTSMEETMSTLDYAFRAKNIRNRPQVNQKMTKHALLKEFGLEIERLKVELQSAREKDGVFLPLERFQQMEMQITGQQNQLTELEQALAARQADLAEIQTVFNTTKEQLESAMQEAAAAQAELSNTKGKLEETTSQLEETTTKLDDTTTILSAQQEVEQDLRGQAQTLQTVVSGTVQDVEGLWAKIGRKQTVEQSNVSAAAAFEQAFAGSVSQLNASTRQFVSQQTVAHEHLQSSVAQLVAAQARALRDMESRIASMQELLQASHSAVNTHLSGMIRDAGAACTTGERQVATAVTSSHDMLTVQMSSMADQMAAVRASVQHTMALATAWSAMVAKSTEDQTAALQSFASTHCAGLNAVQSHTVEHLSGLHSIMSQQREEYERFRKSHAASTTAASTAFMSQMQELMANFVATRQQEVDAGISTFQGGVARMEASVQQTQRNLESSVKARVAETEQFAVSQALAASQARTSGQQTCEDMVSQGTTTVETIDTVAAQTKQATYAAVRTVTESLTKAGTFVSESMGKFEAQATSSVQEATSAAATAGDENQATSADFNSMLQVSSKNVSAMAGTIDSMAVGMQSSVAAFVKSELRVDVPTGATPEKRAYSYPDRLRSPVDPVQVLRAAGRTNMKAVVAAEDVSVVLSPVEEAVSPASTASAVSVSAAPENPSVEDGPKTMIPRRRMTTRSGRALDEATNTRS